VTKAESVQAEEVSAPVSPVQNLRSDGWLVIVGKKGFGRWWLHSGEGVKEPGAAAHCCLADKIKDIKAS
jgi:hypothetical protein